MSKKPIPFKILFGSIIISLILAGVKLGFHFDKLPWWVVISPVVLDWGLSIIIAIILIILGYRVEKGRIVKSKNE